MNRDRVHNNLRGIRFSLILLALTLPVWFVVLVPPHPEHGRFYLICLLIAVECGVFLLWNWESRRGSPAQEERIDWVSTLQNGEAPEELRVLHRGRIWQVRREAETYVFVCVGIGSKFSDFTLRPDEVRGSHFILGEDPGKHKPNCGLLKLRTTSGTMKFWPLCDEKRSAEVIAFFRSLNADQDDAAWLRRSDSQHDGYVQERAAWYAARQNPRAARIIFYLGWVYSALSITLTPLLAMAGRGARWPGIVVLLNYLLAILFHALPDYVSLEDMYAAGKYCIKGPVEKETPYKTVYVFHGIFLILGAMFASATGFIGFPLLRIGRLLAIVLVFAIAQTAILLALQPQMRMKSWGTVAALALLLSMLSIAPVATANYSLDPHPPEEILVTVVGHGGKYGNTLVFQLEDGTKGEATMYGTDSIYRSCSAGTQVPALYHRGLLDLPYVTLPQ